MKRYYPTAAQAAHESRATDFRRASTITAALLLLLSLLSLLLPSCAAMPDGPTHEQQAQRMAPDRAAPATYTDANGYEVPVDTAGRVAGW